MVGGKVSNPVMFLCYNQAPAQLELSKEALASIFAQDIPVEVFAIDNGSTDETWEWMESVAKEYTNFTCYRNIENVSPTKVSNEWMEEIFGRLGYEHVICVPNDVILPPNLCREFLRWPRGVVTGSMNPYRNFPLFNPSHAVNECTPMAVALVRKWFYDSLIAKDGYFLDPRYTFYCSDCDMALRMAACGIRGVQLDLQYYHYGSASHRMAPPESGAAQRHQADADRIYFEKKWGFRVDSLEYGQRPADPNFRG